MALNTTVSMVLIPQNQIFIKSDKYFQDNGISFFLEMWEEYHANSKILA